MLDAESVDEYTERPVEKIKPYREGECAKVTAQYFEDDFDHDPLRGINRHYAIDYLHGYATGPCNFCRSPISVLSDFGWMDFTIIDDGDEPEWVACCWGCAKPVLEAE